MLNELHLPLQSRVEVVFDVVVGPAREELCDFRPPVSKLLVGFYDEIVFLLGPFIFLDIGIEMIVPSINTLDIDRFNLPLSALLSNPAREGGRNLTPVMRPVLFDHVH